MLFRSSSDDKAPANYRIEYTTLLQAQLGNQAPVFYNTTRDADLMQARLESEKGTDHVETV